MSFANIERMKYQANFATPMDQEKLVGVKRGINIGMP